MNAAKQPTERDEGGLQAMSAFVHTSYIKHAFNSIKHAFNSPKEAAMVLSGLHAFSTLT